MSTEKALGASMPQPQPKGAPSAGGRFARFFTTENMMLTPAMLVLASVSIFPFLYLIYASLMDFSLAIDNPAFAGFRNWLRLVKDPLIFQSWKVTFIYAVAGLGLELILGVGIALLLYAAPWGRNLFITLWMLPIFVAPVVAGLLGWFLLNSSYGLYAWLLQQLGVHADIFGTVATAWPRVDLSDVWEWTPLITLIVLSGLQSLPTEPLEAAEVDGASYWQKLRYVILPLSSRIIVVALLIRSMDIMRFIDTIFITTAGGPADSTKIIGLRLFDVAFRFMDIGFAAAIGLSMLVVTIFLGKAFIRVMYGRE
ncbi:carbohydrate ABC transporter permease [Desulforamulus hydrothermalis]|uniref:Binding-protein-dependent transport systems inner membrane component n=1 Tax=Desulforamulus hydrothermalis Lam5 = DSM 18033 TaxID=1121428 RepID=K8E083_9FIRM|nr:sugar ABC transporter permease [Desulforamulus hydrothermalis]CCO08830.1 Binding-protein-dependent transport systems inner membrane component [Desulforamulus hydrothermalis Lam5 = DSM 18033]